MLWEVRQLPNALVSQEEVSDSSHQPPGSGAEDISRQEASCHSIPSNRWGTPCHPCHMLRKQEATLPSANGRRKTGNHEKDAEPDHRGEEGLLGQTIHMLVAQDSAVAQNPKARGMFEKV